MDFEKDNAKRDYFMQVARKTLKKSFCESRVDPYAQCWFTLKGKKMALPPFAGDLDVNGEIKQSVLDTAVAAEGKIRNEEMARVKVRRASITAVPGSLYD